VDCSHYCHPGLPEVGDSKHIRCTWPSCGQLHCMSCWCLPSRVA
jgi:hypothetical protein